MKYRAKNPVPVMERDPDGLAQYNELPPGSILAAPFEATPAALGMVTVICEHREYSMLASDLVRRCERMAA